MEIIDAQLHQPATWLEQPEAGSELEARLATEITLAYMDAAGVDRAVVSANATEWGYAQFAAASFPDRIALTPSNHLDPEAPDLEERLAELKRNPSVIGYRQSLSFPAEAVEKLKAGRLDRLFAACTKLELPLLVLVAGQLPLAADVAKAHPELSLTIDHLGLPQPPMFQEADNPPFKTLPHLLELARYENVTVKLSGAPTLSAAPYPFEDLWPHLSQIVEAFGPDRLMWGTDIMRVTGRIAHHPWDVEYPGLHSYGEAVGFLRDTDHLSASDKQQMLGGTLRRVLGWPSS